MSDISNALEKVKFALINQTEEEITFVVNNLLDGKHDEVFNQLIDELRTEELLSLLNAVNLKLKALNKKNAQWIDLQKEVIRTALGAALILAKDEAEDWQ